jgi:hypothetical protein
MPDFVGFYARRAVGRKILPGVFALTGNLNHSLTTFA